MIKSIVFYINAVIAALLLTGCSSEQKNPELSSSGNAALVGENNARFSMRNIQSGRVILNRGDQAGRELVGWSLFSVDIPESEVSQYPSGWVEFVVPGSSLCLTLVNSRTLGTAQCGASGNIGVFTLIPSTTGAVQIKSVGYGTCILDVAPDSDHFQLGKCVEDTSNPAAIVPERNLWMLNPPSNESPLTPL